MSKFDKLFLYAYGIGLSITIGAFAGTQWQQRHDFAAYKTIVPHDLNVAQNRGYVMGCEAAIRGFVGMRMSDPTEPMWTEWCVKSAISFAKETK